MTDIVRYQPVQLDTERLGSILIKSGFFKDTQDEAQAIVKVLYGSELGFGPIASMMGCYIVNGRPSLSAQLIASAIQKSGLYRYRVRQWTDEVCRIEYFEGEESLGDSTFTLEDAKRAGLLAKGPWTQYPRAMLWARAMSQGARAYTPSVFNGSIYTPEELDELPPPTRTDIETGEVTTATPADPQPDIVRSADEKIWQNWCKVLAKAQGLGLNPEQIRLPIERDVLKAHGAQVLLDIQARERMVAAAS